MYENQNSKLTPKRIRNWVIGGVLSLLAVFAFFDSYYTAEEGKWYAVQNNAFGGVTLNGESGWDTKMPFANRIQRYNDYATLDYSSEGEDNRGSFVSGPISVKFADTYRAKIPVTFRYRTLENAKIHADFRSYDNLVRTLLSKTSKSVTIATAEQHTGEEFFQGGLSTFRSALEDQLRSGLYRTERRKVEVEEITEGAAGEDSPSIKKKLVFKTVPMRGENGKLLRTANPLEPYGIEIVQVTIGEPIPEDALGEMLKNKKRLVAERISAVQEQETAKAQAKTAKLKKDIEIQKAKQDALLAKERETINAQREADVARINAEREAEVARINAEREAEVARIGQQKEKDVAVIQKEKELEIATANQAIQEANARAAKAEAEAIREKGFAEADVTAKHYTALNANSAIVLAEYQKDISLAMAKALPNVKVQMPTYLNNGGTGSAGASNSVQQIFDLVGVNAASELVKKK